MTLFVWRMTAVFFLVQMLHGAVCPPENRKVKLIFDGNVQGTYDLNFVAGFRTFSDMIEHLGRDNLDDPVPVGISKDMFDKMVDLSSVAPVDMADIDKGMLYDILRPANYLEITSECERRLFFRNLAKKSLCGAHNIEICDTRSMRGDDRYTNSVCGNTYVGLFGGFVNALGLEVRIADGMATVCLPGSMYVNYGSKDVIHTLNEVCSIRIHPPAAQKMRINGLWKVLGWLFRSVNVDSLHLDNCKLSANDMSQIAELDLCTLSVSHCLLPRGSLVPLGFARPGTKHTLLHLIFSSNIVGIEDILALTTMSLVELDISKCHVLPGILAPLGWRDAAVGKTLRILSVSWSSLDIRDTSALATLALNKLDVSQCDLTEGCIVPLSSYSSVLKDTLVDLNLSNNDLGLCDLFAIGDLSLERLWMKYTRISLGHLALLRGMSLALTRGLRVLNVSGNQLSRGDVSFIASCELAELHAHTCEISAGDIHAIVGGGCAFTRTLRVFDISNNAIDAQDFEAITGLHLRWLDVSQCRLPMDSIAQICSIGSVAKDTLQVFDVSFSELSVSDIVAIAHLSLKSLEMHNCDIYFGCLVLFGEEWCRLRKTLQKLNVSFNELQPEEIGAFSDLPLEDLDIFGCSIPIGSISCFVSADCILAATLRKLDISWNELSAEDIAVIAGMAITELELTSCSLKTAYLAVIPGSVLSNTLRALSMSSNRLCADSIVVIAELFLERLTMRNCNLPRGCIAELREGNHPIKSTLQILNMSLNELGLGDAAALATFKQLQDVSLIGCRIQEGFVAFLASCGSVLPKTLWKLNLSYNSVGLSDMREISCFTLEEFDFDGIQLPPGSILALGHDDAPLRHTLKRVCVPNDYIVSSEERDMLSTFGSLRLVT